MRNHRADDNRDEPEGESQVETKQMSPGARRFRMVETLCLPLVNIATGLNVAILSPTITDMSGLFGCNYADYTKALMVKSLGILLGSYLGGILIDRFQRRLNLLIAISMLISGAVTGVMPWFPNLYILGALNFIQGITKGTVTVAGSTYTIALWGKKAPFPVHVLHTAATLGQIIGPLMCQPFVLPTKNNGTELSHTTHGIPTTMEYTVDQTSRRVSETAPMLNLETYGNNFSSTLMSTSEASTAMFMTTEQGNKTLDYNELVFVPYAISGGLGLLVAIIFLFLSFFPVPKELLPELKERKTFAQICNPASCAEGNMLFAIFMLIALFLTYAVQVSRIHALNLFLFPIATKTLFFSTFSAALLQTVYFTCATLGRISLGLLSHFITIKIILYMELTISLGTYIGLYTLGLNSQVMLWTWGCLSVFFTSPIYPSVMAWTDRYMEVSGVVVAIIDSGIALGIFISSIVSGEIFQYHGHAKGVFLFCLGCAGGVLLLIIMMQIACFIVGDRYHRLNEEEDRPNGKIEQDTGTDGDEALDESSPLVN